MGFLQITLRALIEESNILLQMWDQNNKGHTERIQELVELGGYKEGKKNIQHRTENFLLATLLSRLSIL